VLLILKTNRQIAVKRNYVIVYTKTTTCCGLRDHHKDIVTKILKIRRNAVQISVVIFLNQITSLCLTET
jgi:hypothetical protein